MLGLPQSLLTDPDHVPLYRRRRKDYTFGQRILVAIAGCLEIAWERDEFDKLQRDFCVSLMWVHRSIVFLQLLFELDIMVCCSISLRELNGAAGERDVRWWMYDCVVPWSNLFRNFREKMFFNWLR